MVGITIKETGNPSHDRLSHVRDDTTLTCDMPQLSGSLSRLTSKRLVYNNDPVSMALTISTIGKNYVKYVVNTKVSFWYFIILMRVW